jgi:hypothetical protein
MWLRRSGSRIFSLEIYMNSGCVPRDPEQSELRNFEGTLLQKASAFVTEYCSHLASGHNGEFDPDRLKSLKMFLSEKC